MGASAGELSGPAARSRAYLFALLLLLSLAGFADSFATSFRYRMLTYARADFGVDISAMVSMMSWIYLASVLAFIPRMLADVVGRKTMLWTTLACLCVFQWLISFAQTPGQYVLGLSAMALFYKSDIWLIILSEEAPPSRRGLYTAMMVAVSAGGAFIMGELVSNMGDDPAAWRSIARYALFGLIAVPFIAVFVRETPHYARLKSERATAFNWSTLLKPFRPGHLKPLIYISVLKAIIAGGITATISVVEGDFLRVVHGINTQTMGTLLKLDVMAVALGWLFAGAVSDRIGRHSCLYMLAALYAGSLIAFAAGAVGSTLVLAAFVAQNFAFAGMFAILRIATVELFPTDCRATASAWSDTFVVLFAAANIRLVGWLLKAGDAGGTGLSLATIILICAAAVIVATPLFMALPETSRKVLKQE